MNSLLADKLKIKSTNINILRFISALAVILCHAYPITIKDSVDFFCRFNNNQSNLGGIAVAVFFFLSGLYVTKSLEKTNSLKDFMKKRCERIFPQLWMVVGMSVILGAIITTDSVLNYFTNVKTYTYLLNGILIPIHNLPGVFSELPIQTINGPLWTMPVEFAAYIGLVILSLLSRIMFKEQADSKRKLLDIFATVILAILFTYTMILMPQSMIFSAVRPLLIFYTGVLYYDFREYIVLNPILGVVYLIILITLSKTHIFNIGLVIFFPYAFTSIALGLPQCKLDFMVFLISYEMYLVGWPIQQVVMNFLGTTNPWKNFVFSVPIDIAIGMIVYKFTDKKKL